MIRSLNAWTAVPVYKFSTLPSELDITPVTRADIGRLMIRWVNSHEPAVQRELLKLWASQGKNITVSQIELMVRRGTIPDEVIQGIAEAYRNVMDSVMLPIMEQTANHIGAEFAAGAGFTWTDSDDFAMQLFGRKDKLAVELTEGQLQALSSWVKQYTVTDPVPSGDLARRVRNIVGLTEREALYVENYTQQLISEQVSPRTVDKLTSFYSRKLRVARAQRIARTEMSMAANKANDEGIKQAIEQGLIDGGALWELWDTNGVDPCVTCTGNQAIGWIPYGQGAVRWDGTPGHVHPHCGCVAVRGINKGPAID